MSTVRPARIDHQIPSQFPSARMQAGSLLFACLLLSALTWLRLETLDLDTGRWLFEASRAADGELPYRDFSWQFPPVSLYFFAGLFRAFGATFAVAQAGIVLWSTSAVLLFFAVARRCLRGPLPWAASLLFSAIGTYGSYLFTLKLYTPAMLTGINGVLLVLLGGMESLDAKALTRTWRFVLGLGSFLCLLSKPEFFLGLAGAHLAFAAADRLLQPSWSKWFRKHMALAIQTVMPAALVYLWMGRQAGWKNVWAGVAGYGGAASSCPWWPTGFGVICVLGGMGEAAVLLAAILFFRRSALRTWLGKRYRLAMGLAAPGFLAALAYSYEIRDEVLRYTQQPLWYRLLHHVIHPNTLLFPFLCLGLVLFVILTVQLCQDASRARSWDTHKLRFWVLLTVAVSLSVRSLFGTLEGPEPGIAVASQPFWLLTAITVLEFLLSGPVSRVSVSAALPSRRPAAVFVAYAAVLMVSFAFAESRRPYKPVQTRAGEIRVLNSSRVAPLYHALEESTRPGDLAVELPYGGGLSFAARLRSPLFTTQHMLIPIPPRYLEQDLERIKRFPPKLVIAAAGPNFNTQYGGHTGCAFPKLVWKPGIGDLRPDYTYPVVGFIQQNYAVRAIFGDSQLLAPRGL